MRIGRTSGIAAALALMLFLVACGSNGGGSGGDGGPGDAIPTDEREPEIDGTYTAVLGADPGNLHPHLSVLTVQRNLVNVIYDRLVYITEEGEEKPWLATSWEVEPDSVTFTVRDDVTCSDGTPLTPSDIAANFEFITDPENESPARGTSVPPEMKATADDDANTVTVSVEESDPFLFHAAGETFIVCRAGLEDPEKLTNAGIGTGMYELTEAVPSDHYTFERRDDYTWGPDGATASEPGTAKTIELRIVPEESTAVNLFLSGELDAVSAVGPDRERIAQQGYEESLTRQVVGQLFFNQAAGHVGVDPQVRAALAQAIDFHQVMQVITGGYGEMSRTAAAIEPPVCTYDAVSGNLPEQDLDAAKATLEAAGWTAGADGIRSKDGDKLAVTFIHSGARGQTTASAAELMTQWWTEVGVEVNSRGLTPTEYSEVIFETGVWDAAILPVNVRLPTHLVPFLSGASPADGGVNFAHLDNKEYLAAVAEAMRLPGAESCPKWQEAEEALYKANDMFVFADELLPTFNDGVTYAEGDAGPVVPTIRLWTE